MKFLNLYSNSWGLNEQLPSSQMAGDIKHLSHDEYQDFVKEQWGILSSKVLCDKRCLPYDSRYTQTHQSSGS